MIFYAYSHYEWLQYWLQVLPPQCTKKSSTNCLYVLFVSPLFDLTNITNFVDDNFIILWNKFLPSLVVDLEKELEMICKWLRDSAW
jgi:hypothetical protein